eukprot:NODE_363_length_8763_cov_0.834718.p5 type:complete len:174 gc:universal NODE_363_length_8763_cov_0.834718:1912-2433(+)
MNVACCPKSKFNHFVELIDYELISNYTREELNYHLIKLIAKENHLKIIGECPTEILNFAERYENINIEIESFEFPLSQSLKRYILNFNGVFTRDQFKEWFKDRDWARMFNNVIFHEFAVPCSTGYVKNPFKYTEPPTAQDLYELGFKILKEDMNQSEKPIVTQDSSSEDWMSE